MILWCDGGHGARENMARDERLFAAAGRRTVLRLFTFTPPGITLGHNQRPGDELDLELLASRGVEWAVRPTGGRAIWHDEEWTFSLAAPLGPAGWAADPAAAYARTCALLARALRALGVPVELSDGSPSGVGRPRGEGVAAPPCFASTARHELTLEGRKFAGIAQRRHRGAEGAPDRLLQQGSLLLGDSHLRLADVMRDAHARGGATRAALAAAAAHAGPWLAGAPLERLAGALAAELPGVERLGGAAGERMLD